MDRAYLSEIENGQRKPTHDPLDKPEKGLRVGLGHRTPDPGVTASNRTCHSMALTAALGGQLGPLLKVTEPQATAASFSILRSLIRWSGRGAPE